MCVCVCVCGGGAAGPPPDTAAKAQAHTTHSELLVLVARKVHLDHVVLVKPEGAQALDGGVLLRRDLHLTLTGAATAAAAAATTATAAAKRAVEQEVKVLPIFVELTDHGRVAAADLHQQGRQELRPLLHLPSHVCELLVREVRRERARC